MTLDLRCTKCCTKRSLGHMLVSCCFSAPWGRQGAGFAKELVEAGTAPALIPLLDPRFELIRIEGLVSAVGEGRGGEIWRVKVFYVIGGSTAVV